MKKLFGLTLIFLLYISILAVFADALSTSLNGVRYISQKELNAHTAEKTQMSLDYSRNNLLSSSRPKTRVYRTMSGFHVIQGASE